MQQTVSAQLVEALVAHRVGKVFCVPGESFLGITDALYDHDDIRLIVCRQEGGAGFMAIADGRLEGRAGVCMVSRGPGLANAMLPIHSALHDSTPLVVLIGQVDTREMGRQALQEQDYGLLLSDVAKAVIDVSHPVHAAEAISRAFHLAESGTPGVVAVVLPEDVLAMPAAAPLCAPMPRAGAAPARAELDRLVTLLEAAERPLVLVGGAFDWHGGRPELKQLAQDWCLPVCPTNRRPHLFDSTDPHYAGYMGIRTPAPLLDELKRTDLLIALGEQLTDPVSQSYTFPAAPQPQMPLVHVWPDPDEIGRVWRPTVGIACRPGELIRALLARKPSRAASRGRQEWVAGLHRIQAGLSEPRWDATEDGVNFAAVACAVARHLEHDAVVTSDAGNFSTFLHRYIGFRDGQFFLSSVVGAMGAGVPMAVAAALQNPARQVVGFVGDGGMLMTGNELATARLYGVSPVLIVSDNSNFGTIAMHQRSRFPGRPYRSSTQLYNPDFVAWAESFGARGIGIRNEAEVEAGIADAFSDRSLPVVVHVRSSAIQTTAWRRIENAPA